MAHENAGTEPRTCFLKSIPVTESSTRSSPKSTFQKFSPHSDVSIQQRKTQSLIGGPKTPIQRSKRRNLEKKVVEMARSRTILWKRLCLIRVTCLLASTEACRPRIVVSSSTWYMWVGMACSLLQPPRFSQPRPWWISKKKKIHVSCSVRSKLPELESR